MNIKHIYILLISLSLLACNESKHADSSAFVKPVIFVVSKNDNGVFSYTYTLDNSTRVQEPVKPVIKSTVVTTSTQTVVEEQLPEVTLSEPYKPYFSGKNDLWDRIRKGYKLPVFSNSKIQAHIDRRVKYSRYLKRLLSRSQPYLYDIVKQIEKRKMPMELVLLPAIESSFRPLALSRANAAGLWQMIPMTASDYNLQQDEWYDERYHIFKSTRAALGFLKNLNRLFGGDWLLTLAAYNYGPGNLKKAINKNLEQQLPTDFWSLELPKETTNYIPKLLALSRIVGNPKEFKVQIPSIKNEPYLTRVKVDRQIDMTFAAQFSGLSLKQMKTLNGNYIREATAPKGRHYLTLPVNRVSRFKRRIAQTPPEILLSINILEPPQPKETQVAAIDPHKVGAGESLWKIAKKYATTISELTKWNDLESKSVKVGQKLVVSAPPEPVKPETKPAVKHKVESGQTLWNIARRYNIKVAELKQWNKLGNKSIKAGQELILSAPIIEPLVVEKPILAAVAPINETVPIVEEEKKQIILTHKVKNGETLWRIARRYNVKTTKIQQWNKLQGKTVRVGQQLLISEPPTPPQTVKLPTIVKHKVKKGESLWTIAQRYKITVTQLKQLNSLENKSVFVGQSLLIASRETILDNTN
ncbi:LysM peptidoglycan-binding domain-containing protein [Candidatus Marithrix sp. Canyon 246]|uniref:LysM peptidoglycan-binding domain-containing protein n=1 Tax=Candidatus Marithrix sp. Canyon 246 TaxID=1827136 RepID=UPI00084A2A8D|nr:LysM peptidoglycan-binding domain-containing protein [Candidatus Marithrix sp. Canyon 246]